MGTIILSFVLGVFAGFFIFALLCAAREGENKE